VTATPPASIELVKTAGPVEVDEVGEVVTYSVRAGDAVTYTFVATNIGNTTLSRVVVNDPLPGLSALRCDPTAPAVLAPGATLTCTATYRATTADGQRGEVVNSATVTGTVAGDATVSAEAGVKVEVQPAATIHLPALLVLADTGGPHLVWPAVAGLLTLGGIAMVAATHRRPR
jgi:hypothetical protein